MVNFNEDKIIKDFEFRKNNTCCVCGNNATHKCSQKVGSLDCDSALCDSNGCNYIHNLKHHYENKELINKYANQISYETKIELLEKEIEKIKERKDYYFELTKKFANDEHVYSMFKDLVDERQLQIERFKFEKCRLEMLHVAIQCKKIRKANSN